ncbi:MAG: hypothetical protein RL385_4069 [Pseudomonadota bacterium]
MPRVPSLGTDSCMLAKANPLHVALGVERVPHARQPLEAPPVERQLHGIGARAPISLNPL